jgi:hypothetical protein
MTATLVMALTSILSSLFRILSADNASRRGAASDTAPGQSNGRQSGRLGTPVGTARNSVAQPHSTSAP